MRHPLKCWPCCLLAVALAGCSTTSGPRFGGRPGSRAIAVVGDRPMPATVGEPGGQVAADVPDPEPRRDPKARISGRVVDGQGKPVAGATVRLADGRAKGGKDIRARTDRAGGFTLNGLRPGSSYSLIAETDDEGEPLTGRAEARSSETGVEISLAASDESASRRNGAGRASLARPISRREGVEGPADEGGPAVNSEDLPPADEAGEPEAEPDPNDRPARPRLSAPVPSVGWKKGSASKPADGSEGAAEPEEVATSSTEEDPHRSRPSRAAEEPAPEDGENPLPPAIDRDRKTSPGPRTSARPKSAGEAAPPAIEPGELALAPEAEKGEARPSRSPEPEVAATGPPPMPPLEPNPAPPPAVADADAGSSLLLGPDPSPGVEPPPGLSAPSPPAATHQDVATKNPAFEPVLASTSPPAEVGPSPGPGDEYNPFLLASAATPARAEVARARESAPEPPAPPSPMESDASTAPPKKKWGELKAQDRPSVVVEPTKASPSLLKRLRGPSEGKDSTTSLCSYDSRLRRVVDFRLPDLEGKPVRFQDLDADYVLLDFWGTWCPPCLEAVPHLVALQKQYGPRKLRVVGVACEQVEPGLRRAKVEEVARRLGINYPVLLSGMDGKPCPVQESLQIQAYPTAILLDRQGRILWRNAGSTPAGEKRLDKVLASLSGGAETVRR